MRVALIAFALLLLQQQSHGSAQASRDAAEPLLAGVVEVYASPPAGRLLGSGFVVHHDQEYALVVTAQHVIDGVNAVDVAFRDRATSPYQAALIAAAADTDLALLRVTWGSRPPPTSTPRFIVSNPSSNEMLSVLGSAGDLHWARTSAGMLTQSTDPANINRFRFDKGTAEQGFSGGPVINAATGQLVGVLQRLVGQQALALKIESALDVINSSWGVPELNRIERHSRTSALATSGSTVSSRTSPVPTTMSGPRSYRQIQFRVVDAEAQGGVLTIRLSVENQGADRELRASYYTRCGNAAEIIDDRGKTYTTNQVQLGNLGCGSRLLNGVPTQMTLTFRNLAALGGVMEADQIRRLTLPSLDIDRQDRGSIEFLNIPIRKPR